MLAQMDPTSNSFDLNQLLFLDLHASPKLWVILTEDSCGSRKSSATDFFRGSRAWYT